MKLKDVLKPKSEEEIKKLLNKYHMTMAKERTDIVSINGDETHTYTIKCTINGIEYDYGLIEKYI